MTEPTYQRPALGTTTVEQTLGQLTKGEISTQQAADAFTDAPWPPPAPRARTLAEIESDPDPRAAQPGDFAAVEQAYVDGEITLAQYEQLANAVAGSAAPTTQDTP